MATPSKFDNDTSQPIRDHIASFIINVGKKINFSGAHMLEIGSQNRTQITDAFSDIDIKTFDIVDDYSPDYLGDITKYNDSIEDSKFDIVACMEVLEHTLNPFDAIKELRRITKDGGYILFSAPLNWRIHGPTPDCWRFTEHGFRVLLKDFDIIEIDILETEDRELFPLHYNILAKNNKIKNVDARDISFRWI